MNRSITSKIGGITLCLIGLFVCFGMNPKSTIKEGEKLVVFTQSSDTKSASHFQVKTLPQLQSLAEEMGIQFQEIDIQEGAPSEVSITPLIVFQQKTKRTFFAGRNALITKVRQFIRTSRTMSLPASKDIREQPLLWKNGRAQIGALIKITEPKGKLPRQFDKAEFIETAHEEISRSLSNLQAVEKAAFNKNDRLFYWDFHPYFDGKTWYVSTELYSQFNCHTPVYQQLDQPIIGSLQEAFTRAGRQLEKAVIQVLETSKLGDGFDPVSNNIPVVSWESLGLELSKNQNSEKEFFFQNTPTLPKKWKVEGPVDKGMPMVQFQFPPPLDRYIGEASELEGELTLNENHDMQEAQGQFIVNTLSISMGEEDFDKNIYASYLKAYQFPTSTFTFEKIEGATTQIQWGKTSQMSVLGTLRIMRKSIKINVSTQITPIMDESGIPLLEVSCSFRLNLEDYKIKGPDGPEPARNTLIFNTNFLLSPL